ncbi:MULTISPECIES: alpha/beta fold hydrolase [unclassified Chelatococcus]|uniref:alpha/beta hydrolase n=1 Tax=unclassified Chelatococcus TaxID=2638111 RepID=UPI001BCB4D8B|nr:MULTISPECIES: alpha/beta fold hydrolase [unclassified Chelatococcus]MBS7696920.1 alpha/beta fold hydrolase [Chelatococcus sp. YT9]MBX3555910.1 alpha/beta fold hydrolase [Chelatococcus sp.]
MIAAFPVHAETIVSRSGMTGVFAAPAGKGTFPCAVIVPGSGPTDRDGNNPYGVSARPYALLADALLAGGIATLRYDKRLPSTADAERELTIDAAIADAAEWLRWCRAQTGISAAFLIGHSEGGVIALALAQREPVAGLVLLTTPGKPVAELIRKQLAEAPEPLRGEAATILERLQHGDDIEQVPAALAPLFRPSIQPFLRSLMALDPDGLARQQQAPLLVIAGGRDIQVPPVDARPGGVALTLPAMNHVLKDVEPGAADNLAAYRDPDRALAEGLVQTIVAFIRRHIP